MQKPDVLNQYMNICKDVLSEMEIKLSKNFKNFIIETLLLYMVIPQRINYLQLGRYRGTDLINSYRARFQIEFNFRDAKQFTGFNQCQARNLSKLNFNASLAAVNVAKVLAKEREMKFAMASIKTIMHNTFLMQNSYITNL